jgi:transcriptional regulator with XRE-family HTH domain
LSIKKDYPQLLDFLSRWCDKGTGKYNDMDVKVGKKGHLIDQKIGEKIRAIRKGWGLSQIELAERVGISFQQIQKYEKGSTRISIMRLMQIAEALGVHITQFFEKGETPPHVSDQSVGYSLSEDTFEDFKPLTKEEVTLLRLFRKIKSRHIRQGLIKQMRGAVELEKPE